MQPAEPATVAEPVATSTLSTTAIAITTAVAAATAAAWATTAVAAASAAVAITTAVAAAASRVRLDTRTDQSTRSIQPDVVRRCGPKRPRLVQQRLRPHWRSDAPLRIPALSLASTVRAGTRGLCVRLSAATARASSTAAALSAAAAAAAKAAAPLSAGLAAVSMCDGHALGRRHAAPVVRGPHHGDRLPPLLPLHAPGRTAVRVVHHSCTARLPARPAPNDPLLPAAAAACNALAALAATFAAATAAAAHAAAGAAATRVAALCALSLRVGWHPGALGHLRRARWLSGHRLQFAL